MTFYKIMVTIDMCTDFELLEVKVSINFLGMEGFSPRKEGRYSFGDSEMI